MSEEEAGKCHICSHIAETRCEFCNKPTCRSHLKTSKANLWCKPCLREINMLAVISVIIIVILVALLWHWSYPFVFAYIACFIYYLYKKGEANKLNFEKYPMESIQRNNDVVNPKKFKIIAINGKECDNCGAINEKNDPFCFRCGEFIA